MRRFESQGIWAQRREKTAKVHLFIWLQGAEARSHKLKERIIQVSQTSKNRISKAPRKEQNATGRQNYIQFINKLGHSGDRIDVLIFLSL